MKIDRGGIRDIEFLVQCLQRVYGGREPWLRSGGTLFSLQKLHDKRHISGHDFHELNSAYTFLRHLEHRLQLQRGQQIHRLPRPPEDLIILQRAMAGLTPGHQLAELTSAVKDALPTASVMPGTTVAVALKETPGRSQVSLTPSGGLTRSGRFGGAQ